MYGWYYRAVSNQERVMMARIRYVLISVASLGSSILKNPSSYFNFVLVFEILFWYATGLNLNWFISYDKKRKWGCY